MYPKTSPFETASGRLKSPALGLFPARGSAGMCLAQRVQPCPPAGQDALRSIGTGEPFDPGGFGLLLFLHSMKKKNRSNQQGGTGAAAFGEPFDRSRQAAVGSVAGAAGVRLRKNKHQTVLFHSCSGLENRSEKGWQDVG